jgi:hypothetical protein
MNQVKAKAPPVKVEQVERWPQSLRLMKTITAALVAGRRNRHP